MWCVSCGLRYCGVRIADGGVVFGLWIFVVWCAECGLRTEALAFASVTFTCVFRIVRYIRTGAEAQDSLSAAEEHIIRFDRPGGREDSSLSSAVPGGDLDF